MQPAMDVHVNGRQVGMAWNDAVPAPTSAVQFFAPVSPLLTVNPSPQVTWQPASPVTRPSQPSTARPTALGTAQVAGVQALLWNVWWPGAHVA